MSDYKSLLDIGGFSDDERAFLDGVHRWYTAAYQPMNVFFQSEFRTLMFLREQGRGVSPSELTGPLGVTRQRVTAILAALRGKGYVTMDMDPDDRRKMRAQLTDAGRKYFDETSYEFLQTMDYVRSRLGSEGMRQFVEIIDRIIPGEEEK